MAKEPIYLRDISQCVEIRAVLLFPPTLENSEPLYDFHSVLKSISRLLTKLSMGPLKLSIVHRIYTQVVNSWGNEGAE